MPSTDSARAALRHATARHHDAVDAIFSKADLSDRADYGRFLQAQAAAFFPVEAALTRDGVADVVSDWSSRQRSAMLRADLAALGIEPPAPIGDIAFAAPAALLGGVYVLEGSRLGGTLLARSVPSDFPQAFLGAADPAAWRCLIVLLEEQLSGSSDRLIAIKAACETFGLFERAGQKFFEGVPVVG
jgi:heme oxygenase (biliverdin-IX-beta and delta-forming)